MVSSACAEWRVPNYLNAGLSKRRDSGTDKSAQDNLCAFVRESRTLNYHKCGVDQTPR
jgi:hypothetical protein